MVRAPRVIATTLLGLVFGIICMLLTRFTAGVAYWPIGVSFLLTHTVMGFAIGTSALKMNWAAHGILWGSVFGVFLAISRVGTVPEPWIVFIASVIWGFLVETLATKAFKQPQ